MYIYVARRKKLSHLHNTFLNLLETIEKLLLLQDPRHIQDMSVSNFDVYLDETSKQHKLQFLPLHLM